MNYEKLLKDIPEDMKDHIIFFVDVDSEKLKNFEIKKGKTNLYKYYDTNYDLNKMEELSLYPRKYQFLANNLLVHNKNKIIEFDPKTQFFDNILNLFSEDIQEDSMELFLKQTKEKYEKEVKLTEELYKLIEDELKFKFEDNSLDISGYINEGEFINFDNWTTIIINICNKIKQKIFQAVHIKQAFFSMVEPTEDCLPKTSNSNLRNPDNISQKIRLWSNYFFEDFSKILDKRVIFDIVKTQINTTIKRAYINYSHIRDDHMNNILYELWSNMNLSKENVEIMYRLLYNKMIKIFIYDDLKIIKICNEILISKFKDINFTSQSTIESSINEKIGEWINLIKWIQPIYLKDDEFKQKIKHMENV